MEHVEQVIELHREHLAIVLEVFLREVHYEADNVMWESPVGYVHIIVMKLLASYAKCRGVIHHRLSRLVFASHLCQRKFNI